ncbi:MAG: hypothetical protein DRR42_11225 [Gammaproteobacteria bacterium]|nr:MAG: hypothetical protein DRR42_11225 [Gammaproteobacteria bacterium]
MIIESVTVENFRSFYGEQTVNFSTDPVKNTTIIYAMNGVGKTNLLNAILWCLHGEFSPGFKNSSDILNWEAKKRGRKSYHVTVNFTEDGKLYSIKRSAGDVDNFKVFRIVDGNAEEIKRNATVFVNSIIPKDMAGYFINDGEGSDLTVDARGMISVKRSIRDILGFQVAEKSLDDLAKIKKEYRDELKRFDVDNELAGLEEKLEVFETSIKENQKQLSDNQEAYEDYKIRLDQIDKDLDGANLVVIKKLQSDRIRAERDHKSANSDLKAHTNKKISLIREYSWVAFAHKLSDEALDFIDEAELEGKVPAPFNVQLVNDILKRSECICGACIKPGSEAYQNIKAMLGKAADPALLNRLQKARSRLTAIKTLAPQAKERLESNFTACVRAEKTITRLADEIREYSIKIEAVDDQRIEKLEKDRRLFKAKCSEANNTIIRKGIKIEDLVQQRKKHEENIGRLKGLSPRARLSREKISLVEKVEAAINRELAEAEGSIKETLEGKINHFLDKYLRQDYRVKMTSDFKIGLMDRDDRLVPPGGGQSAILSFIYISSLIAIARERRDMKSSILTPGAIAPLIFDAPFSNLDPSYAPNVARELPKLVDQLIILMYQDKAKNVDSVLESEGKLGREYYLTEEIAGPQGEKLIHELDIDGKRVPVTVYDAPMDKVLIKEAKRHV